MTLFNRGQTDPSAFPELEQLRGDRNGDLAALRGHSWETVVDVSGTQPDWVRRSARLLSSIVDRYLVVSSTAVYETFANLPADESLRLRDGQGDGYGARKAGCEAEAEAALPGRVCLPRPVYAVGPGDPDSRLDAWLSPVSSSQTLRLPSAPEDVVLFVDVRDLAAFVVVLLEARETGPFNVANRVAARQLVAACASVTGVDPEVEWRASAEPPPMLHRPEGSLRHWGALDTRRAAARGFAVRPLAETLTDAWSSSLEGERAEVGD